MQNKGLLNHFKFRTKYWQERHKKVSPETSINEAILTGTHMPPRIQQHSPQNRLTAHLCFPHRQKTPLRANRHQQNQNGRNYKLKLKMQLLQLSDDFSRPKTLQLSRKDKITMKTSRYNNGRPQTSLTIELQQQGDIKMQQKLSFLQSCQDRQFLPLHSSRRRSQTPF